MQVAEKRINTMDAVLEFLMSPVVNYNLQQERYWGVLFGKDSDNSVSAIVASPLYIIQIRNLPFELKEEFFKAPFYSYFTHEWMKPPYPRSANEIINVLRELKTIGKITIPLPNFINFLDRVPDETKIRSRVIFSPGILLDGEVILKFTNNNGRLEMKLPNLQKPIIPAEQSKVPLQYIHTTPNTVFKGALIAETDDFYIADVFQPFGKVKIGIKHSPAGFDPYNMMDINNLVDIPPHLIMGVNKIDSLGEMKPIHMDCIMLYDLIKIFPLINTTFVEIYFGENTKDYPVVITNVKQRPEDPEIHIVIQTLNPEFGVQRR